MRNKIITILGPTSSGKTDLSIRLALFLNKKTEIVSADSRQVYKGMDIGTGKIKKEEMEGIPHHLLDIVSPKKRFTVANYKKKALKVIKEIHKKGKIPMLVGGTGFYIQAVIDGIEIPKVKPDWDLRKKLEKKSTKELYEMLKKKDKRRAKSIDKNNPRRLQRALEIVIKTGKPIPLLNKEPKFNSLLLGIKRENLKERIEERLEERLKEGMVKEVKTLINSGVTHRRLEELGLEYRYVSRYLRGELNYEEMKERLKKEIEKFSKRQLTWFKKDKRIIWIKSFKEAKREVKSFLRI